VPSWVCEFERFCSAPANSKKSARAAPLLWHTLWIYEITIDHTVTKWPLFLPRPSGPAFLEDYCPATAGGPSNSNKSCVLAHPTDAVLSHAVGTLAS